MYVEIYSDTSELPVCNFESDIVPSIGDTFIFETIKPDRSFDLKRYEVIRRALTLSNNQYRQQEILHYRITVKYLSP